MECFYDENVVEFDEASTTESEWSEETSSSDEEDLAVDEQEEVDYGLPEMVVFLHEPMYQICKDVVVDEEAPSRGLTKYRNVGRCAGKSGKMCFEDSFEQRGSNRRMSDDEVWFGTATVGYDEGKGVYKKVELVRDVENAIHRSPPRQGCYFESRCNQEFNQVGIEDDTDSEILDKEVVLSGVKESFYFDSGSEESLKYLNSSPNRNVKKLLSLKELMSVTSQDDNAADFTLSPPPMAYSMQKYNVGSDLHQPYSSSHSFSFPVLAQDWFGSPVRMAGNGNRFALQGWLRTLQLSPSSKNVITEFHPIRGENNS